MGDWLQAVNLSHTLHTAMAATNEHFTQPAANVLAAMDANSPTVLFLRAFRYALQSTMAADTAIAVRYDDTPPTLASHLDPTSGVSVFLTTAIDNTSINLMHMGVIGQSTMDAAAARAASIARFGPIGATIVVSRTAGAYVLRCLPTLDGILDAMSKKIESARVAIVDNAPPVANAVGGRETAMFLRSNQDKETAVRRLLETLALAPDHTGARQLFTNLRPTDAVTMDVSGAYDMSAIIVRIRNMMRLAAKHIDKDEVKLTDDQWRRLLLLDDPPLHLLNTAAMLKTELGPDTFSDMAARAAPIIGLVYGKPLEDAITTAGVDLATFAKTDGAKALTTQDLFDLLSRRLTNAFASPLIYNGGATDVIRARPFAERVAEALRFTTDSVDFKAALEDAKSAATQRLLAALKQEILEHRGQGSTKRDSAGNLKVEVDPPNPSDNKAWRANKPPGDHHVNLPCFFWALNMPPCKGRATCQRKLRHDPDWDSCLSATDTDAYLAWFRTHPDIVRAAGNPTA